jgi:hypothetical protein
MRLVAAGASPIYTERIRKIMNIEGGGVPAIFKQLQLDPGFAQHYMDVEYEVVDEHHGFFQLRSRGALLDVRRATGAQRCRSAAGRSRSTTTPRCYPRPTSRS